jgi:hypothetical protein
MRTLSGSARSASPFGSVVLSEWPPCQYSVEVTVCRIFGQVVRARQRSSRPSSRRLRGSRSFS